MLFICTFLLETSGVPSCSNMAGQDTCTATSRNFLNKSGVSDHVQRYYDDEKTMIMAFQSFVQSHDPDMIVGYEIQMLSWGYLIDRAKELDVILCPLLSRVPTVNTVSKLNDDSEKEAIFYGHVNDFKITGRILLNLWRVMRSEVINLLYLLSSEIDLFRSRHRTYACMAVFNSFYQCYLKYIFISVNIILSFHYGCNYSVKELYFHITKVNLSL